MPKGTSTSPAFLTAPSSEKIVVPGRALGAHRRHTRPAPRVRIGATLAQVFTLLTTVGLPHRPLVTGYGGRDRGSPECPSSDSIRAVSSPQMIGPGPAADRDAERPAAAQDVFAQKPAFLGLARWRVRGSRWPTGTRCGRK